MAGLMVMLILAGADKAATKVKAKRAAKRAAKQAEEQHQTREQYFHSNKAREAASDRARAQEELEDEMGLESPPPYEGDAPRYSVGAYRSGTQRMVTGEGSAANAGRNVLVRRRSEERQHHDENTARIN